MKYFIIFFTAAFFLAYENYSAQTTMPVELVYFKYQLNGNNVLLYWETATEVNNYGFNVERLSDLNWDVIDFVKGEGVSNSPKYYYYEDTSTFSGQNYIYRLKQIDHTGGFKYSDTLYVSVISSVDETSPVLNSNYILEQNYPNPFNPETEINYALPSAGNVILRVYDFLGRESAVLVNKYQTAGAYKVRFSISGYNLSSGIYFYSLSARKIILVKKMIVLK